MEGEGPVESLSGSFEGRFGAQCGECSLSLEFLSRSRAVGGDLLAVTLLHPEFQWQRPSPFPLSLKARSGIPGSAPQQLERERPLPHQDRCHQMTQIRTLDCSVFLPAHSRDPEHPPWALESWGAFLCHPSVFS